MGGWWDNWDDDTGRAPGNGGFNVEEGGFGAGLLRLAWVGGWAYIWGLRLVGPGGEAKSLLARAWWSGTMRCCICKGRRSGTYGGWSPPIRQ